MVDVACEVGKVARALVWARAVALLPPDDPDPDDFRSAPVDWLLELLDGPPGVGCRDGRAGDQVRHRHRGGARLRRRPRDTPGRSPGVVDRQDVGAGRRQPDADRARAGHVHDAAHQAGRRRGSRSRSARSPGYSSICIARGLAPGGTLLCCDVSEEWTAIARDHWAKAGIADRIELKIGARRRHPRARCPPDPPIDIAFIDADKTGYRTYYDEIVERLRPGGLVLLDNVLWSGNVVDESDQSDDTVAIRAVNDHVAADDRVEAVMLPIADGLTIARKR